MKAIAFIVNGGIGFICGELFAISLAWVFLENLNEGNWRWYLITLAVFLLITVIGIVLVLEDSPRHLLTMGDA